MFVPPFRVGIDDPLSIPTDLTAEQIRQLIGHDDEDDAPPRRASTRFTPTSLPPGPARLTVLAWRAARGLPLFHDHDIELCDRMGYVPDRSSCHENRGALIEQRHDQTAVILPAIRRTPRPRRPCETAPTAEQHAKYAARKIRRKRVGLALRLVEKEGISFEAALQRVEERALRMVQYQAGGHDGGRSKRRKFPPAPP